MEMSIERKVLEWFAHGETGLSSETMALAVCGLNKDWKSHPHDPSDFNRCLKLINHVPEIKDHMDKISALSDTWSSLVDRWNEVEKCFLDEAGYDWCKSKKAPKTYALMKEIGC